MALYSTKKIIKGKKIMITYSPVAGLTIKEAFVKAVLMARKENDLVEMDINDIKMYITPKTDLDKAIKLYHYKKDIEYKIKVGLIKGSR